jgi:hypothetical protein
MSRADHVQFTVRSAFARTRARELARLTGMTATQIVEEALRAYAPPAAQGPARTPGTLVRRGPLLVRPADRRSVSLAAANAALEAARNADADR